MTAARGEPSPLLAVLFGESIDASSRADAEPTEHEDRDRDRDIAALEQIARDPGAASLSRLCSWRTLAALGVDPPPALDGELLGVVFEVGVGGGLDILGVYADRTVRSCNYSGARVVWERPDASLDELIDVVLDAARAILPRVGPWEGPRRPPPAARRPPPAASRGVRPPESPHAGRDPLRRGPDRRAGTRPAARPLLRAGTALMRRLTELPR